MTKQQFGVIGLAVMGKNLALNVESRGYSVSVFNRTYKKTEDFMANEAKGKNFFGAETIEAFVDSLEKPRKIMLMVKAGPATDKTIETLRPLLDEGDIIIDGGIHSSKIPFVVTKSLMNQVFTLLVPAFLVVKKVHLKAHQLCQVVKQKPINMWHLS